MRDENTENAEPLLSQPISEITIERLKRQFIARIRRYLEHELQCELTTLENGGYLIQFPQGTVEEIYAGESSLYSYNSTIRFPNGATLTKHVYYPINETQSSKTTTLHFPKSVLETD